MTTTIALKEQTKSMLNVFRVETNAKNFDEVIRDLILKSKTQVKSMRGMAKNTKEFAREEIDRFA